MDKFMSLFFIWGSLFAEVDHKSHWDGKDYHNHSQEQFHAAVNHVLHHITWKGWETVLDIGCGDGKISALIAEKAGSVIGVDISPSMIAFAKKQYEGKNLFFEVQDATDLPFKESFDYVVSFTTLQWVSNQEAALEGIYQSLKKKGRMIIDIPMGLPREMQEAVETVIAKREWKGYFKKFSPGWRFFEKDEYEGLLKEALLDPVAIDIEVIPHEFSSSDAFKGFLSQWFPYLTPIPKERIGDFLNEVTSLYRDKMGETDRKEITFQVQRMKVEAVKRL